MGNLEFALLHPVGTGEGSLLVTKQFAFEKFSGDGSTVDLDERPVPPDRAQVEGSGSKVGSKYSFMIASTNEAFCPTLKGQVSGSHLTEEIGSVLEIVINGLSEAAIKEAMHVGISAICKHGHDKGIYRISAGNYGGKLGPHHFHLREIMR